MRIVVRGTLPCRSTRTIPTFPRSSCFCRAEGESCGAWVRKSWHRAAPTSLPSSSICAKRIRATRIVHGTRVRDCDSFRAFDVGSNLFDSERARPTPRPCGDGSVVSGLVMICSHLSEPNAVVVDCSCSTGPAMLFTLRRCSDAKGREHEDGLPM